MRPKALNSPPRSHRVSGGERTRVDLTMARMAGPLLGGTLLGLSASLSAALNLALLFQLQGAFRQQRCDEQHQHATEKQQQQQQQQQPPPHHQQQQQQHPPQTPQQQQFQDLLHHHEQLQQQHQYTEQQLQYPGFQPQQQLQQQQPQPQQQTDESGNAAGAAAAIMRTSAMCLAAVALSLNLCCASICVIHALLASRMVHAHRAQRFVESTQKARLVTMALFCLALLSFTAALSLHAFLVLDVPAFLACAGALGCGVLLSASGLVHGLAAARRSAQLPARVPRAPATLMPPPPLPPPQQQHHQHQQHHHPQQHQQQQQQQQPPGSGLQARASACRPEPRARALSFWNQVALSEHGRSDDNGDDFTLAANDCAAAGSGGAAGEELCTLSASLPHPRHHQRVPPHNGRERFVDVPAESCGSRRKTASMSDIVAESRRQQPHQQQPHQQQQQQHQQQKQQQHQQQHHHHHQQQQPPPQQHQQQQQRHHMDPLSLLSSKMAAAGGGCSGTATMGSRDRQGANQHGPVSGDARPWNGVTRELKAAQARWRLTDISNTTLV